MFDVPGNPVCGPGMRGHIYQMLYKSILREKVRPGRLNRGVFHATNDRLFFAPGLEGGVFQDFSLRSTTAPFVYLPHSAVVSQFETALLRPRAACRAVSRATPPQTGGSCGLG